MSYDTLVAKAKTYFPDLQIKYKDQSTLMKITGKLMFFNPDFMTNYVTTLGNTVYVPNEQYIQNSPLSFNDVFIHECTHMYDEKRLGFWYNLGYVFPQVLSLVVFIALVFFTWKLALLALVLFLLPWPAPWRAYFEKRAYFVQMYAGSQIYGDDPEQDSMRYAQWFRNGDYYWMWIFEQDSEFAQEAVNIKAGKPACSSEPALFQQVNDLIAAAKQ